MDAPAYPGLRPIHVFGGEINLPLPPSLQPVACFRPLLRFPQFGRLGHAKNAESVGRRYGWGGRPDFKVGLVYTRAPDLEGDHGEEDDEDLDESGLVYTRASGFKCPKAKGLPIRALRCPCKSSASGVGDLVPACFLWHHARPVPPSSPPSVLVQGRAALIGHQGRSRTARTFAGVPPGGLDTPQQLAAPA